MININESYPELFKKKDQSYGTINENLPIVVFMDGVGITRNHEKYNLMEKGGYLYDLHKCAKHLARNIGISCIIYTALDEISFIYKDTKGFIEAFQMDNTLSYISALFIQQFNRNFWRLHPEVDHKLTIFNIEHEEIDQWIKYRSDVCRSNAFVYAAKHFLNKDEYHNRSTKEIIHALKERRLYEKIPAGKAFFNGMLYQYNVISTEDLSGVL